jgi:enoyl-CoA hydratase/carnithine racemase
MANEVLYEAKEQVAVITLNRPERMNAISMAVRDQLGVAFERFEADGALRVAILTGAGDRSFCAGMDLKEAAEIGLGVSVKPLPVLGDNIKVSKPVIAAVNGHALAGGWLLAQMCDLCVASDNAQFGITEGKVGRGMPWVPPLMRMIPQRIALELLLTGRSISAQRAYEIGFVNRVVPQAQLMEQSMALAREIIACAPLTVAAAKELVYLTAEMGTAAALRTGNHVFDRTYRSEDALEGPRAFKEKRKPNWQGK